MSAQLNGALLQGISCAPPVDCAKASPFRAARFCTSRAAGHGRSVRHPPSPSRRFGPGSAPRRPPGAARATSCHPCGLGAPKAMAPAEIHPSRREYGLSPPRPAWLQNPPPLHRWPAPAPSPPPPQPATTPPPPPRAAAPHPPPRRHRQKSLPVQQALVLRGHTGDHEYDLRAGQHLLQRSRLTTHGLDVLRGQPRVIGFDRRVKWREQGHDGAPEIAKTDETQVLTMQGIGVAVCVETVFFAPLTEIPVGTTDATRQVERHAECRFCHRLGKYGTGAENPDATREGNAIVDIRQEVAFHIEYRPQMRCQVPTRCRHIDLANKDFQTRGQRFELGPGGPRSVMNMQIPQFAQALQLGCREDVCNPARRRNEEHGFGRRRHGRSPVLSCLFEKMSIFRGRSKNRYLRPPRMNP